MLQNEKISISPAKSKYWGRGMAHRPGGAGSATGLFYVNRPGIIVSAFFLTFTFLGELSSLTTAPIPAPIIIPPRPKTEPTNPPMTAFAVVFCLFICCFLALQYGARVFPYFLRAIAVLFALLLLLQLTQAEKRLFTLSEPPLVLGFEWSISQAPFEL